MPEIKEISPLVVNAFSRKTKRAAEEIQELVDSKKDHLFNNLGMGPEAIDSISGPLTRISKKYEGGISVPISAIRNCETVTDCIELTTKRSNGKV